MKIVKISAILFLLASLSYAQPSEKKFEWNGYGQFRLYKYGTSSEGSMIRRMKLWVKGNTASLKRFRYKVMGIFTYNQKGYFGLLDAYGDFSFKNGYLRFGQQIPEFSLQRMQPDWKIPVMERAAVINRMIPAAQSAARDLGVQVYWSPAPKIWQFAAGVFNSDGANLKKHNSANFLYSLRTVVKINFSPDYRWSLGGSAMYRKADNYDFSLIFGKDKPYTGDDFRYGFESLLKLNRVEIQAEYIGADFDGQTAYGYYAYVNYNFSGKDQAIVSYERLVDLNKNRSDDPWAIVGYNRLLARHNVKLMINAGTQFNGNYSLSTQIQLFFN